MKQGADHSNRVSDENAMQDVIVYEAERRAMIRTQLRGRGLRDEKVLEAMLAVPRHEFVPPGLVGAAYDDRALPIGAAETISQPYVVAAMTAAARVEPGDRALEVGTGSGYQAAILAHLGARVYSVERNPKLSEEARQRLARLGYSSVEIIHGDGSEGHAAAAPYQVILVTAAAPRVPPALLDQLAEGGRLVIPVGDLSRQDLQLIFKHAGETATRVLDPVQFVPLVGRQAWPE
jgi:protein-L-isoaspartate(D-aspartate) O-methyltransferase